MDLVQSGSRLRHQHESFLHCCTAAAAIGVQTSHHRLHTSKGDKRHLQMIQPHLPKKRSLHQLGVVSSARTGQNWATPMVFSRLHKSPALKVFRSPKQRPRHSASIRDLPRMSCLEKVGMALEELNSQFQCYSLWSCYKRPHTNKAYTPHQQLSAESLSAAEQHFHHHPRHQGSHPHMCFASWEYYRWIQKQVKQVNTSVQRCKSCLETRDSWCASSTAAQNEKFQYGSHWHSWKGRQQA